MKTILHTQKLLATFIFLFVFSLISQAQYSRQNNCRNNGYIKKHDHRRNYNNFPMGLNIGYRNTRSYYIPTNYYQRNSYYRQRNSFIHFGPAFGVRINLLPIGYNSFYYRHNPYYYNEGVYYRPYESGGYEVIPPPLGASVKNLPSGTSVSVINGQKYYELGGTYYLEEITVQNRLQYRVVGTDGVINTSDEYQSYDDNTLENNLSQHHLKPTKIYQLPANCKVVMVKQQKYYLTNTGKYYKEIIDANNNISYDTVSIDNL
jgi:hypothetical protein